VSYKKIDNNIKNDYSPIRTGNRNFHKFIQTNSSCKNNNLETSDNKIYQNDKITPTKERNPYINGNGNYIKTQLFYDNLNPQSNKPQKCSDYKESKIFNNFLFSIKNNINIR
jgi:hypothetical protein